MKKNYKFIFILEVIILFFCLSTTDNFFKEIKCENINCKILDDDKELIKLEDFQEIFNSIKNKKISTVDLIDLTENLQKSKIIDDIKILKTKKNIYLKITPHKIVGIAYYKFENSEENLEEENNFNSEFILDNGEKLFLKIKNIENFIPVILDEKNKNIQNLLPILDFINKNSKIKAWINTISLKKNNLYLTTILNDCSVNFGNIFNKKSIIYKICNMHKIIYLSNNFPNIEFNEDTLFLHKRNT